jgi:hypothetical protein
VDWIEVDDDSRGNIDLVAIEASSHSRYYDVLDVQVLYPLNRMEIAKPSSS